MLGLWHGQIRQTVNFCRSADNTLRNALVSLHGLNCLQFLPAAVTETGGDVVAHTAGGTKPVRSGRRHNCGGFLKLGRNSGVGKYIVRLVRARLRSLQQRICGKACRQGDLPIVRCA